MTSRMKLFLRNYEYEWGEGMVQKKTKHPFESVHPN